MSSSILSDKSKVDFDKLISVYLNVFPDRKNETADTLKHLLQNPACQVLIAIEFEIYLSFLLYQRVDVEFEIIDLGVHSQFRRQGRAQDLLMAFLDRVHEQAGQKIFLEVSEGNRAAQALYSKNHFKETGRRTAYYQNGSDAILMEWNREDS